MTKSFLLTLGLGTCLEVDAQFKHNPYQLHDSSTFALQGVIPNSTNPYIGEYQIHWSDWHWANNGYNAQYKIEVVSFPFTPRDTVRVAGDRVMGMPDINAYRYVQGDDVRCTGWAWPDNTPELEPDPHDLMRVVSEPINNDYAVPGSESSQPASLISLLFKADGQTQVCGQYAYRNWLPHSILKHTLYVVDTDGRLSDSVSWVYDNTRGRMRYYPFTAFGDSTGAEQHWDVCFRPKLLTDPNGHFYDAASNATWYMEDGQPDSTVNYFPASAVDQNGSFALLYPDSGDVSTTEFQPGSYTHPPPYALIEAPLLNFYGNAYAGYALNGGMQETFFNGDTSWEVPHTYLIDKPIDLLTINAAERIIYNPSEVLIQMDSTYAGDTRVFPSGYTFKTVHGVHPSVNEVLATDPDGLYPDPLIAPVPSTLGDSSSTYFVKSGNTLRIEPCVTIMDAYIVVEDGATLAWDSTAVNGNYHVAWQPGSINAFVPADNERPCPWNCYSIAFYEANDITISGLQTWSTTSLPGDGDSDGRLRIRGTLRIPQDQRLIIEPDVVLEFGPNARVIVERGGQLNAEGVTFTSACELMWEGVEVWGEINHAQYPYLGNTATGRAFLENCTVQNARLAAAVYKPGTSAYNGGVLQAAGTVFRNNHIDVEIRPTYILVGNAQLANICRFDSCTFESTKPLLDPAYYPGGLPLATSEHLRFVDVKNIQVVNCTFRNQVVTAPHLRGTGIMGFNASFTARGNSFEGLSQGVWAANFPGMRAVRVRENTFNNNIHSVVLQGTVLSEVTSNTINVPRSDQWPFADDDVDRGNNQPVGVYLLGSTDFNVEDNTITGYETGVDEVLPIDWTLFRRVLM